MAMTDCEVQRRINHMIAFIDQEAMEKIEEIDAKAEEEFNMEKGRIVQQQRRKIMDGYSKKEKQFETQLKIQSMNMLNRSRMDVLKGRQTLVDGVIEEARSRIVDMTETNRYRRILRDLILEGLYQAMESAVLVRCREKDTALVQSVLPEVVKEYKEQAEHEVSIDIDHALYLPPYCSGGVEVIGLHGRLKVENTLGSRLEIICQKMAPHIRVALFGANSNRKFTN